MPLSLEEVAALTALGIVDPAGSPWKRIRDAESCQIFVAEWVCQCGERFKRVTSIPWERPGRAPVLIGQCSECLVVTWCLWVPGARERTWTGPRQFEPARPMYQRGYGA